MITTTRRLNISLTKEDEKKLNDLCALFGETPTPTIKRCINEMHSKIEKHQSLEGHDCECCWAHPKKGE